MTQIVGRSITVQQDEKNPAMFHLIEVGTDRQILLRSVRLRVLHRPGGYIPPRASRLECGDELELEAPNRFRSGRQIIWANDLPGFHFEVVEDAEADR